MILNKQRIIQNGFTRNRKLWDIIPCLSNLRFSLSVDSKKDAVQYSINKTICFPDVDRAEARVFANGLKVARCSGYFCYRISQKRTTEADCVACCKDRQGCFFD